MKIPKDPVFTPQPAGQTLLKMNSLPVSAYLTHLKLNKQRSSGFSRQVCRRKIFFSFAPGFD
jgi:hypothetical protein